MLESLAHGHLAVAEWLRGRLPDAERAFSAGIARWMAADESALVAWGCHHLGLIQRAQGRLDAALSTYQGALEIAAPPSRPALPAAGAAYVGMAEVAYQRGELDSALRHVTAGIALCRQLTYTQPLATGLATLAWIRQATGDAAGALDAIAEAEKVAPSPDVVDLLNPVPAQRARLLLVHGDLAAAARWTEMRGVGVDDEACYPREPAYLVLARVLIAGHAADRAIDLLERLHADAAAQGRTGSVIEIQALRALAMAAESDQTHALAVLASALTLACSQGYVRVFADEGPAMGALLGRLIATQPNWHPVVGSVPVAYLGRLARAFEPAAAGKHAATRPGSAATGLVLALSDRELQVLHLLADGKQNREIADELYITRNTVKKHITHILDKLGATNRTQATARARELGLLG